MSERFLLLYPCYAIMSRDCRGGVVIDGGGRTALVLLTDEDLLRSFRAQHGHSGPTIRFDWDHELWLYLHALPPEVTHVALDPGKTSVAFYPVDLLKQTLGERLK
jgi:hypothetical protein